MNLFSKWGSISKEWYNFRCISFYRVSHWLIRPQSLASGDSSEKEKNSSKEKSQWITRFFLFSKSQYEKWMGYYIIACGREYPQENISDAALVQRPSFSSTLFHQHPRAHIWKTKMISNILMQQKMRNFNVCWFDTKTICFPENRIKNACRPFTIRSFLSPSYLSYDHHDDDVGLCILWKNWSGVTLLGGDHVSWKRRCVSNFQINPKDAPQCIF